MKNQHIHSKKMESGAALAIGLILLAVAMLISIAAMRSSVTEERIAGNQREISEAFMAAETGLAKAFEWFNAGSNYITYWGNEEGAKTMINALSTDPRVAWEITSIAFSVDANGDYTDKAIIEAAGRIVTTATERNIRIDYRRPVNLGVSKAFMIGLLSDQNVTVNGASTFVGGVHANGSFWNPSEGSVLRDGDETLGEVNSEGDPIMSSISAHQDVNFGGDLTGSLNGIESNADPVDVPYAGQYIEKLKAGAYGTYTTQCSFPNGGDLGGRIYFCDGPVTIGPTGRGQAAVEISHGTIVSSGSVTINGRSELNSNDELDFAVISAGTITNNGRDDMFGLFWADGGVVQNGASWLNGSIVSRGSITRNGAFNFRQVDNFSATLPIPQDVDPPAASAWKEI